MSMTYGIPEPGSFFKVPEDDDPSSDFTCEECKETMDEADTASDYFEQTGDDRVVCSFCAEDSGR